MKRLVKSNKKPSDDLYNDLYDILCKKGQDCFDPETDTIKDFYIDANNCFCIDIHTSYREEYEDGKYDDIEQDFYGLRLPKNVDKYIRDNYDVSDLFTNNVGTFKDDKPTFTRRF